MFSNPITIVNILAVIVKELNFLILMMDKDILIHLITSNLGTNLLKLR